MKKSLSLLVAIALVVSMFASIASANTTASTPAAAGQLLNELGVIKGDLSGDLLTGETWSRQNVAVLLSRLFGEEEIAENTANTHGFSDVRGTFYNGYISWAKEKGLMEGNPNGTFGFDQAITYKQFAAVVLRALGVDTTGENFANTEEWAVEYGIVPANTDWNADAVRGVTYVAIVAALNTVVPDSNGRTLGNILGLEGFEITQAVAGAAASGVKKVAVTFASPVNGDNATFVLRRGDTVTSVASTTWNEAKTVATLETSVNLQAGDYTVTVSGVEVAEGRNTASFSVTPERAETIEVAENGYRQALTGNDITKVDVSFSIKNQYGENVSFAYNNGEVVVTPSTTGVTVDQINLTNKVITLANVAVNQPSVAFTVVELKNAKSLTKTINVQNAKMIDEVTLSTPEIPSGKTALESNTADIVVPYTAKDQFGNDVKLAAGDLSKLTFISSDTAVVDPSAVNAIEVTADNKLTIDLKQFSGPKNVALTVIVNASGKSSRIEFTVNGQKTPDQPTLELPSSRFGNNETYEVVLKVKDQYGADMTADEIVAASNQNPAPFTIISGNVSVFTVANPAVHKVGNNAVIRLNGVGNGTANLTVTVNATSKSASQSIQVVDAKYAESLTLSTDANLVQYFEVGGNNESGVIKLTAAFTDQYGDVLKTGAVDLIAISTNNTNFQKADGTAIAGNYSVEDLVAGINVRATGHNQSTEITAKLYQTSIAEANLRAERKVTVSSVASDAALTYEVESIGTISNRAASDFTSQYAKEVKVSAKNAAGAKVNISTATIINFTSSDSSVVVVEAATRKIAGVATKEGNQFINVTVAKPDGTTQTIAAPVTVSNAAPVVTSLVAKAGDTETTRATVTLSGGNEIADLFVKNDTLWFEVKDQFGTTELATNATVFVTTPNGAITNNGGSVFNATVTGTHRITVVLGDRQAIAEVVVAN